MKAQAKALESRYRRLFSNPSANADDYVRACLPPNASAYTDTFNGRWRLTYKCGGTKLCRSISWTAIGDRAAAVKALTALWSCGPFRMRAVRCLMALSEPSKNETSEPKVATLQDGVSLRATCFLPFSVSPRASKIKKHVQISESQLLEAVSLASRFGRSQPCTSVLLRLDFLACSQYEEVSSRPECFSWK